MHGHLSFVRDPKLFLYASTQGYYEHQNRGFADIEVIELQVCEHHKCFYYQNVAFNALNANIKIISSQMYQIIAYESKVS